MLCGMFLFKLKVKCTCRKCTGSRDQSISRDMQKSVGVKVQKCTLTVTDSKGNTTICLEQGRSYLLNCFCRHPDMHASCCFWRHGCMHARLLWLHTSFLERHTDMP